ncbi:MAG TPA: amidohydrolase family protein [Candidatus Binatia bacterium]|nr:amidohydrolase family protein [Candidatus Binatia bacterium]
MAIKIADIVFRNGLVVTPGGTIEGGAAIVDGKIATVGRDAFLPSAEREIDLAGNYLMPGAIDPECHLGSHRPLADDFQSETRAAAAAGVTTWGMQLVSLAITGGADKVKGPADIPSFTRAMPLYYEASRTAAIDYFLTPILGTDEHVAEIPYMAREHGISSFKLHLQMQGPWKSSWPAYSFDDGSIYNVFAAVAKLGAPAIALLHCENWEIARVLQDRLVATGRTDMGAWDDRSPAFTEAGHARTYLYYARIAGCPIYIVHATTAETFAEIEKARAEGLTVYSEIGTHYLVLHKDAWKINVPLRDRSTHETLWRALASGAIDCIGSDHVAHTRSRESMETGNVWTTISGFPSRVEGMLPMMLSEGVNKGRISIERLAQVASENPARIFGLYPRKGAIVPGADADLIVVDLKRRATIAKQLLHTITPWSIYEGWDVTGWPVMTLVRGNVVMEWPEHEPRAKVPEASVGQYIKRALAQQH